MVYFLVRMILLDRKAVTKSKKMTPPWIMRNPISRLFPMFPALQLEHTQAVAAVKVTATNSVRSDHRNQPRIRGGNHRRWKYTRRQSKWTPLWVAAPSSS